MRHPINAEHFHVHETKSVRATLTLPTTKAKVKAEDDSSGTYYDPSKANHNRTKDSPQQANPDYVKAKGNPDQTKAGHNYAEVDSIEASHDPPMPRTTPTTPRPFPFEFRTTGKWKCECGSMIKTENIDT